MVNKYHLLSPMNVIFLKLNYGFNFKRDQRNNKKQFGNNFHLLNHRAQQFLVRLRHRDPKYVYGLRMWAVQGNFFKQVQQCKNEI